MNLQIALDRLTREECLKILRETELFVDWIELGTGVIKEYGMSIVREIKQVYPHKTIVADMKTCDAGKYEAAQAFEAGADITTVMAFSADKTIADTLKTAEQYGKRIMIDLLGISERSKVIELQNMGVELVSLHFGKDMQAEGEMGTDLFSLTHGLTGLEVAVAGGINLNTLPGIIERRPNTVIVGSAITKAGSPYEAALAMKGLLNQ
ncbi:MULTISPECIES: 3-hexulose-6-phosphate synthase [Bacillaceae]|jgi:3-hexulose-6-phosphate synthase|uniref:3-hexulose-6-phosphate synthase n=1 Tax=Bacillaceae TaxID=186817 RepID=UPI0013D799C9|nr:MULTISPECIES: 3-hexulose-6-phosphate synthase [Bacillaceae]MCC3649556.1 orotidine 5'-phosphate decarboxylase [Cytobacillus oceanisediminis]MCS0656101.1 orotidine 5'-phosphate decarboxylase [Cytobacillus firmus]